jgi:hypothetical protein
MDNDINRIEEPVEMPEGLIRMAHKQLDPIFERNDFITKHELRSMMLYLKRLKRCRASYKTRTTFLEINKTPRSQASIEATAWAMKQSDMLVNQIEELAKKFICRHPLAPFVEGTRGLNYIELGLLISAFDIKQAETCGRFWAWAGLDPKRNYAEKRDRLANEVRSTLFMVGDKLLRYNKLYRSIYYHRRAVETIKNVNGEYATLAKKAAIEKYMEGGNPHKWASGMIDPEKLKPYLYGTLAPVLNASMYDKYGAGVPMLPPVALHARAQRYMVKALLAHLHYCWYYIDRGHPPPKPYVLDLRNRQRIEVPPQFEYLTVST